MREYSLPRQLARLPQLLVLPLTFLLTNAAKKAPSVVEGLYSNGLYPMIRDAVSKLTRALPFSAAETVFFWRCADSLRAVYHPCSKAVLIQA